MNRHKPEVLAIIPARGGSKGIPRKNVADLAGMPLIAYSILAARNAKLIDRVVVSTEDEEIADVAKKWGAEVPFLRPEKFATDTSSIGEAISYTLKQLGPVAGGRAIVHLYPTSPFRTPTFVDEMLSILFSGYSSVTTVKKINQDPRVLYISDDDNELVNILEGPDRIPAWKTYYRQYPLFKAYFNQKHEKHYFHTITDKCMFIDIDTRNDLLWAEAIIEAGLFNFGF
jgi:CMP-N-acetylneuraminic acid synthetase